MLRILTPLLDSIAPLNVAPVCTVAPTISGDNEVDDTLTASGTGTWTGSPALTAAWHRGGIAIYPAQTGLTYVLTEADQGKAMTYVVLARTFTGWAKQASNAITVQVEDPPVCTVDPEISGNAVFGATLTTDDGTFTGLEVVKSRKWYADEVEIIGATGLTYVTLESQIGKVIQSKTTGTNAAGADVSEFSNGIEVEDVLGVVVTAIPDDDEDGVYDLSAVITGGSGSRSYLWELTAGTGVIDDETAESTTLTVEDSDDYTIKLTVTDDTGNADDSESFTFTIQPPKTYDEFNTDTQGDRLAFTDSNKTVTFHPLAMNPQGLARFAHGRLINKWVVEATVVTDPTGLAVIGAVGSSAAGAGCQFPGDGGGGGNASFGYTADRIYADGTGAYISASHTLAEGDIVSLLMDFVARTFRFYVGGNPVCAAQPFPNFSSLAQLWTIGIGVTDAAADGVVVSTNPGPTLAFPAVASDNGANAGWYSQGGNINWSNADGDYDGNNGLNWRMDDWMVFEDGAVTVPNATLDVVMAGITNDACSFPAGMQYKTITFVDYTGNAHTGATTDLHIKALESVILNPTMGTAGTVTINPRGDIDFDPNGFIGATLEEDDGGHTVTLLNDFRTGGIDLSSTVLAMGTKKIYPAPGCWGIYIYSTATVTYSAGAQIVCDDPTDPLEVECDSGTTAPPIVLPAGSQGLISDGIKCETFAQASGESSGDIETTGNFLVTGGDLNGVNGTVGGTATDTAGAASTITGCDFSAGTSLTAIGCTDGGGNDAGSVIFSAIPTSPVVGMTAWWKADAIGGLSDGDPITTWADSSGNGYDFVAGSGVEPIFKTNRLNSLPAVNLNSITQQMTAAAVIFPTGAAHTVFAVLNNAVARAWPNYGFIFDCGTSRYTLLTTDGYEPGKRVFLSHDSDPFPGNVFTAGEELVIASRIDGANSFLRLNADAGRKVTWTAGGGTTASANPMKLGTSYSTAEGGTTALNGYAGDICEIIIYPTGLSDGDIALVESYLMNKYGL